MYQKYANKKHYNKASKQVKQKVKKEYITISLSRALSKAKIIDSRIMKAMCSVSFRERKTLLKTETKVKEFIVKNKSLYSKITDLLTYKTMLLQKIAFCNATVMFDKDRTLYTALVEEKILKDQIDILQTEINFLTTTRAKHVSIFSKETTNKNIILDLESKVNDLIEIRENMLKKINEINKKTYFKIPK